MQAARDLINQRKEQMERQNRLKEVRATQLPPCCIFPSVFPTCPSFPNFPSFPFLSLSLPSSFKAEQRAMTSQRIAAFKQRFQAEGAATKANAPRKKLPTRRYCNFPLLFLCFVFLWAPLTFPVVLRAWWSSLHFFYCLCRVERPKEQPLLPSSSNSKSARYCQPPHVLPVLFLSAANATARVTIAALLLFRCVFADLGGHGYQGGRRRRGGVGGSGSLRRV